MLSFCKWKINYLKNRKGAQFLNRKKLQELYSEYKKEERMKDCSPCDVKCVAGSVCTTTGWTYTNPIHTSSYSLGTVEVAPKPAPDCWGNIGFGNQEKGNNPMNYATATVQAGTTETQDQRKYLSDRLEGIYWTLLRPLEATFGLTDDDRPRTPKELKQRIADGKFVIKGIKDAEEDEDDEDEYFYGGWTNMIRWCDPAKKADHDGYQAAMKELQDLRQKTLDIIKIDEPKAGLDAIKAFEQWKPTGAAN